MLDIRNKINKHKKEPIKTSDDKDFNFFFVQEEEFRHPSQNQNIKDSYFPLKCLTKNHIPKKIEA